MLFFDDEFSTIIRITILKNSNEINSPAPDAISFLTYCDFVGFKVHSLTRWKTFFIRTSIPIVEIILENVLNTSDFVMIIASTEFFKVFKTHKNTITASTVIQNLLFGFLPSQFSTMRRWNLPTHILVWPDVIENWLLFDAVRSIGIIRAFNEW